ncbi:Asp23/Gls24 family envelope stress response protein [Paenibacillus sp. Leaf72]|uniref:Asp23/Gls24 family envelope stress response protein n=1 Tax=Paenibacillus sp. Leaf72 TaxID=1736234 RepID=UPI0006FB79AF|nr:Asp23/Gls24 family envelope stress response protein [Paenibacillus sp. Leaf72]KQO04687.1 hypothetical protein ASF12_14270 [Paenibacillus sp. Leaf72]
MLIQNLMGTIKISYNAVSKIVGMAASTTSGIASMSTGIVEGITNKLSGKSLQSGIELKTVEAKLEINLKIVIHYGVKMHDVCRELQHNVRETVEKLTGLSVSNVNVKVQGISIIEQNVSEKMLISRLEPIS